MPIRSVESPAEAFSVIMASAALLQKLDACVSWYCIFCGRLFNIQSQVAAFSRSSDPLGSPLVLETTVDVAQLAVDEIYEKIQGQSAHLFKPSVDKHGDTIDFHLSPPVHNANASHRRLEGS